MISPHKAAHLGYVRLLLVGAAWLAAQPVLSVCLLRRHGPQLGSARLNFLLLRVLQLGPVWLLVVAPLPVVCCWLVAQLSPPVCLLPQQRLQFYFALPCCLLTRRSSIALLLTPCMYSCFTAVFLWADTLQVDILQIAYRLV